MPRTALITGLGLMGGSLAAALAHAGWRVLLHHRRAEIALRAERAGYGRAVEASGPAMAEVDIAVVCTPVSVIAETVRALAAAPGSAVITDVGSTKGRLCAELAALAASGRYVGSHPMAGSHRQGFDHADPLLYRYRTCVVTPTPATPAAAIASVVELWRAIGARTLIMTPADHDRAVAEASHLPHVLASVVAAGLTEVGMPLAANGFRDTTRVAASSAELWRDILADNRDAVIAGIDSARTSLAELRGALERGDGDGVRAWLERGRAGRERFEAGPGAATAS